MSSTCEKCGAPDAVKYHQNTQYVDDERNWVTLCEPCTEENEAYWADMWAEYYSGCM